MEEAMLQTKNLYDLSHTAAAPLLAGTCLLYTSPSPRD